MKRKLIVSVATVMAIVLGGCWGKPWPSRGLTVDLKLANASYAEVVKGVDEFLIAQKFRSAGKGGYDAINNTSIILDYEGPDRLFVSVGPDGTRDLSRVEKVFISFNQDQGSFSSQSNQFFEAMVSTLESRWPRSVAVRN
jgi:hypothetical protein